MSVTLYLVYGYIFLLCLPKCATVHPLLVCCSCFILGFDSVSFCILLYDFVLANYMQSIPCF